MRKKIIALLFKQQGSTLPFVALALGAVIAMFALVIDGGTLIAAKVHLQKTANAAALSGAQEATNSEIAVTDVVNHILDAHHERESLESLEISMNDKVTVKLHKNVPLSIMRLFGKNMGTVEVSATAQLSAMGKAIGAVPLGLDEDIELIVGQQYQFKVDETGVVFGNFGPLVLESTGGRSYRENLQDGYDQELQVGDIIPTQTGNMVGPTRQAVQARLDSCPYPPGEMHHRDCPRILLIPIYTPHAQQSNQVKEVRITGFAYFYMTEPMSDKDKTVSGIFIRRAGTGTTDPAAVNKGAYSIRLTE